ncbi:SDR family oxidoreductase [Thiorhodococcus mannitoliphagus]|uniref:SDR family oxidoreductase n=1 Tax=Thiorhodococcus mannitoliphagus TaxID=329406 RepID=A0A6P1E3B3_9GAMM|nr:SDR family oxidoreductase [Thiorhodococcus mannitoliphagus]NEX23663.1 SDR family oxidoreductase [Thiorhodococcus mannitoliphagus]
MPEILIVGASSGIGRAVTHTLTESYSIRTASRQPSGAAGERHIHWDAAKDPFPIEALPKVLSGLVYCPGSIRLAPFERLDDAAFREDFELNLLGAVRAIRAALPALKASGDASVVLFSSVAVALGMPMHASIAAAKGAVEGLVRALAAELAPGVRVNAIAPSLTETPLAGSLLRTERQRQGAAERHPLARIGRPEDIAAAAAYLLSSESSWMTGQVLRPDGGMSSLRRFG